MMMMMMMIISITIIVTITFVIIVILIFVIVCIFIGIIVIIVVCIIAVELLRNMWLSPIFFGRGNAIDDEDTCLARLDGRAYEQVAGYKAPSDRMAG